MPSPLMRQQRPPALRGKLYLLVKWLSDHEDEADCQKHADMGFEVGWGKALDQLVGIADQLRE